MKCNFLVIFSVIGFLQINTKGIVQSSEKKLSNGEKKSSQ